MVMVINKDPHPSVIRETICKNCGATLAYVPNDIHKKTYKDIDGGTDTSYYIGCPCCQHQIYVKGY